MKQTFQGYQASSPHMWYIEAEAYFFSFWSEQKAFRLWKEDHAESYPISSIKSKKCGWIHIQSACHCEWGTGLQYKSVLWYGTILHPHLWLLNWQKLEEHWLTVHCNADQSAIFRNILEIFSKLWEVGHPRPLALEDVVYEKHIERIWAPRQGKSIVGLLFRNISVTFRNVNATYYWCGHKEASSQFHAIHACWK